MAETGKMGTAELGESKSAELECARNENLANQSRVSHIRRIFSRHEECMRWGI